MGNRFASCWNSRGIAAKTVTIMVAVIVLAAVAFGLWLVIYEMTRQNILA